MNKAKRTVRRKPQSRQHSSDKRENRKGFKTYIDSMGRPYIKVDEAISSEAGERIFKDLEAIRNA